MCGNSHCIEHNKTQQNNTTQNTTEQKLGKNMTIATYKAIGKINKRRKVKKVNKMAKTKEINVNLTPVKKTHMRVEIIGDSDLMLNKMGRYTQKKMIWEQEHPKGSTLPDLYNQPTNPWEKVITSIYWLNPIEFHDEDISLYSEEEWRKYMTENQPCILAQAFLKSFKEAVITFYKSSGLKGSDLRRSMVLIGKLCPITFAENRLHKNIVNTQEDGRGSAVLLEANVFSGWRTEIEFMTPSNVFPKESMLSIIQSTGEFIGIGSQRANGYGRYHIGNVDLLS